MLTTCTACGQPNHPLSLTRGFSTTNAFGKQALPTLCFLGALRRFLRFPGGCYIEGDWMRNAFFWKDSIGANEARTGHMNGGLVGDRAGWNAYQDRTDVFEEHAVFFSSPVLLARYAALFRECYQVAIMHGAAATGHRAALMHPRCSLAKLAAVWTRSRLIRPSARHAVPML
jgi:hypothetical protein